jgi:hypothetical protein
MSKRQDWAKTMRAEEILAGAETKLAFHKERLKFWEEQDAQTRVTIRESGISVNESLAAKTYGVMKMSTANSNFRAPSVTIDPELEDQLQECFHKKQQHIIKIREYESWIEFLKGDHGPLTLEIADFLFFFESNAALEDQ